MLRTSTNWLALGRAPIRSGQRHQFGSRSLLDRSPSVQRVSALPSPRTHALTAPARQSLPSSRAVHKSCPCALSASHPRALSASHPHNFASTPPKNMPNPNKVTERLFQSPSKYIQGPSAVQNAGKYLSAFGKAPLLLSDELVYGIGQ